MGGSGYYYYAEVSSPRRQGDNFTLAYDGSTCSSLGLLVSRVAFYYHMYGSTMGDLRLCAQNGIPVSNDAHASCAAGSVQWYRSGNQGNVWQRTGDISVYLSLIHI